MRTYCWSMRTSYALVAAAAASVLLAGCAGARDILPGASDSPSPSATVTSTSTSTSTVTATASPTADASGPVTTPSPAASEDQVVVPPNANTSRKAMEASVGSEAVLSAIRTASHTGVDRVVLEFTGTGSPGWDVAYVNEATSQGSGNPITIEGESILKVTATGTTYPQSGAPGVPAKVAGDGKGNVTEVVNDSTFEGTTVVYIGLKSGQKPFDVLALQSPTRLAVDIVQ